MHEQVVKNRTLHIHWSTYIRPLDDTSTPVLSHCIGITEVTIDLNEELLSCRPTHSALIEFTCSTAMVRDQCTDRCLCVLPLRAWRECNVFEQHTHDVGTLSLYQPSIHAMIHKLCLLTQSVCLHVALRLLGVHSVALLLLLLHQLQLVYVVYATIVKIERF